MVAPNQQSRPPWRSRVKDWLHAVDEQRWNFRGTLQASARSRQAQFPRNLLIRLLAMLARRLAIWIVKGAIKDAATDLGISLSDADAEAVADIAVSVILS